MISLTSLSQFSPRYLASSVLEIDPFELQRCGITHIVFDLDDTLVAHGTSAVSPAYVLHIAALRRSGLQVLLGSNTRRDTSIVTELLSIVPVPSTLTSIKPLRSFYKRVAVACETSAEHIAFAGDHIINDVWGPNRAGFTTILVRSNAGWMGGVNRWYYRWLQNREKGQ